VLEVELVDEVLDVEREVDDVETVEEVLEVDEVEDDVEDVDVEASTEQRNGISLSLTVVHELPASFEY
jgi:hypothetical protein